MTDEREPGAGEASVAGLHEKGRPELDKSIAVASIVLLVLAVIGDWRHAFYSLLLRWAVSASALALAVTAFRGGRHRAWAAIMVGWAVLYNPLVHFHFPRERWQAIDVAAIVCFAVYFLFAPNRAADAD